MATIRNGIAEIGRPPGRTLSCGHGRTRPATVPSGCPRKVEISIDSAGAISGDYIQIGITLQHSCVMLPSPCNEIDNSGSAGCGGYTWFRYTVPDPPVWESEILPQVFGEVLMGSPSLLNSIYAEFDEDNGVIVLTGRHPGVCFDLVDQSQGFIVAFNEIYPGEPSAIIPGGSAVCIDSCGFVHLLGSVDDCEFAGFTLLCGDWHEYCGNELKPLNHHTSGDDIEVLVGADSISVIPANLPSNNSDVPAFDPSAPFGTVLFVPYGAPAPAGGYLLEGWELESWSPNPLEVVLTHNS